MDLPPTTGPCPHCAKEITSPGPAPAPEPELDPIFGKPVPDDVVIGPPVSRSADAVGAAGDIRAAEEAERKARAEAEAARAAEEQARQAGEEEARRAAEEAERKARAEAEAARAAEEADRKAREAAEEVQRADDEARLAREEAGRRALEELEREERAAKQAAEEAERKAMEEAERRAAEERREREAGEARREAEEKRRLLELEAVRPAIGVDAKGSEESQDEPAPEPVGEAPPPVETVPPVIREPKAPAPRRQPQGASNRRKRTSPVGIVVVLLLLAVLGGGGWFVFDRMRPGSDVPKPMSGPADAALREKQYLEKGWEADAVETLGRFLAASRPAGKAAYSIDGSALLGRMEAFYQGAPIDDSNTPAEAFSVFALSMQDRQRGIFMLTFDQPPVFEIDQFFAPLAPLDVQYKLREPDMLLASVARSSNFTAEPMKVHALFKRTPDGLRLDWETFVQTKYRTLRDFLELPVAGRAETFRVILSETVPEKRNVPPGHRTYLVSDPAHRAEDSTRVNVAVDSEVGRALSILNWRGTREGRAVSRTATIELRWTREEIPQLEISRFLCWEFLGVGGEAADGSR